MANKMREKGITYHQTLALEKENSRLSKQIRDIKLYLIGKTKEIKYTEIYKEILTFIMGIEGE